MSSIFSGKYVCFAIRRTTYRPEAAHGKAIPAGNGSGGFSLVELVLVIALISILSAIAIPIYSDYKKSARNGRVMSELRQIETDIFAYYVDNGTYPPNLAAVHHDQDRDPWGRQYQYANHSNPGVTPLEDFLGNRLNEDFDLYSAGQDGVIPTPSTYDAATCYDDIVRTGAINSGGEMGFRRPD